MVQHKIKLNENLEIFLEDISYRQSSGDTYEFNVTVNNQNVNGNINVTIRGQNKSTGLISKESSKVESISGLSTKNFIISINTANIDYFHVYADEKNDVIEAIGTDNYVIVPFIKKKEKAYIEVGTGNSKADEAIKAYLKLFFDEKSESQADFIISIGRNTAKFNSLNDYTKNNLKWYYDKTKNTAYFNNNPVGFTAYSGLVGRFFTNGKSHIFAYGKNIEGDVAAVKKLISAKNILLTKDPFNIGSLDLTYAAKFVLVIDEKDVTGLSVMDLMHRGEAHNYYNDESGTDGDRFKEIVEKILLDNNFEIAIKTVQTLDTTSYGKNTTLRLKSLNSDFSTTFKEVILNNTKPVVMSGGIFSDLFTFEDGLGGDLVKEGYDVWTIEMNGCPQIECATCPDYTYQDQVDYFWPLIGGVRYLGKNKVNYIQSGGEDG